MRHPNLGAFWMWRVDLGRHRPGQGRHDIHAESLESGRLTAFPEPPCRLGIGGNGNAIPLFRFKEERMRQSIMLHDNAVVVVQSEAGHFLVLGYKPKRFDWKHGCFSFLKWFFQNRSSNTIVYIYYTKL